MSCCLCSLIILVSMVLFKLYSEGGFTLHCTLLNALYTALGPSELYSVRCSVSQCTLQCTVRYVPAYYTLHCVSAQCTWVDFIELTIISFHRHLVIASLWGFQLTMGMVVDIGHCQLQIYTFLQLCQTISQPELLPSPSGLVCQLESAVLELEDRLPVSDKYKTPPWTNPLTAVRINPLLPVRTNHSPAGLRLSLST